MPIRLVVGRRSNCYSLFGGDGVLVVNFSCKEQLLRLIIVRLSGDVSVSLNTIVLLFIIFNFADLIESSITNDIFHLLLHFVLLLLSQS
jgi:hypothetical protein